MTIMDFAKHELSELLTDKVFIISVFLQLTIISTLLFVYAFYSTINSQSFPVTVTLDKYDPLLIEKLNEQGVNVVAPKDGALLPFPPSEAPKVKGRPISVSYDTQSNRVQSDVSNIFSGYAISKIREAAQESSFESALDEKGLAYTISDTPEGNFAFLPMAYGILIPIAIILPAFILMGFTLQGILLERKTKIIELILVSPITDFQIAQIKVLPYIAVSCVLSFVWLLMISNTIAIQNIWLLLAISAFFSIIIISMSTIISCNAGSVKEANALSSIAGMAIPLIGLIPYNAFSDYMPTSLMGQAASSYLTSDLLFRSAIFGLFSLLFFLGSIASIRRMRVNFS